MAITIEKIHKIADMLAEQDIQPTLAEVRKALGGGSFTTISEAMKSWRQDKQQEQKLQQVDLPSNINDRLKLLGAEMWQSAVSIANERLVSEHKALAAAQEKSQAENNEAKEAVRRLEANQIELLVELDSLSNEAKTVTADAARLRLKLNELKVSSKIEVDAVNQELNSTQNTLIIQQERTETANAKAIELRSQFDNIQKKLTQSLEIIASYKATSNAQLLEVDRLKAELILSKQQHEVTRSELVERTVDRDELNKELSKTEGQLGMLTNQMQIITEERARINYNNNQQ
ncbi:chromosome segregation ATPase [Psychrobacter sp. PL19]|uniref:DNA-binding protein n=1 Tax=Psychrobacter sp. PL19 TaxID=2760711 RepID=UPI001AE67F77